MKIKISVLFLVMVIVLGVFSSCKKDENESGTSSIESKTEVSVKDKIDSLYTSGLDRTKALVGISKGKTYTTTGDAKDNGKTMLTDGVVATEKSNDKGWATFNYSSPIEIVINLGSITENINSFSLNMLQIVKEGIYSADEALVYASLDGTEYIKLGKLSRSTNEDNIKLYELTLSGGVKASYIKITLQSSKTGIAYVDEVSISAYTSEANEETTYKPFYDFKMPEKVTEPAYWDKSESDYNTVQNLVLKRLPSIFTMRVDVPANGNSPASDLYKLTDGVYNQTTSYKDESLFQTFSPSAYTDARLLIFDLEKTSAINGFKTSYIRSTGARMDIPEAVSIFVSEDGVTWDSVYRKDGIRHTATVENKMIAVESTFEKKYSARFVAIQFDIEGNTRLDEIEIFGTKSTAGAEPVSAKGDSKFFVGNYPQPEDIKGINDVLLMYHCYSDKIKGTEPVLGGFTEEQCMALLGYYDTEKKLKDYYFDTFLFIGGGQSTSWNKADMFKVYMDNLFSQGYNLDALNSAAAKTGEALGNSSYKAKVMLTIFLPSFTFKDFGDLNGDGKAEDLSTLTGKQTVIDWLLGQYITRFNAVKYTNLELVGFYWHDEVVRYDDINLCASIRYTADKAHENGYITMACPYHMTYGYYEWQSLGFDLVFMQPNFYWHTGEPERIPKTAAIAKSLGLGVEMEVESDALTDAKRLKDYISYLKGGIDYGYMNAIHMYYYSHPFYGSYTSTTKLGRQLYDLNYQFIKGTLTFKTSEKTYDEVFKCEKNNKIVKKLTMDYSSMELSSSAKYGTVKISEDGMFTYTPFENFTGEDSFFVAVIVTGCETVYYEIKVNVA